MAVEYQRKPSFGQTYAPVVLRLRIPRSAHGSIISQAVTVTTVAWTEAVPAQIPSLSGQSMAWDFQVDCLYGGATSLTRARNCSAHSRGFSLGAGTTSCFLGGTWPSGTPQVNQTVQCSYVRSYGSYNLVNTMRTMELYVSTANVTDADVSLCVQPSGGGTFVARGVGSLDGSFPFNRAAFVDGLPSLPAQTLWIGTLLSLPFSLYATYVTYKHAKGTEPKRSPIDVKLLVAFCNLVSCVSSFRHQTAFASCSAISHPLLCLPHACCLYCLYVLPTRRS